MIQRKRIRYKTWYWGNWVWEGSSLDNSVVTLQTEGFEEYDEEKHGWHNSEEFNRGLQSSARHIGV